MQNIKTKEKIANAFLNEISNNSLTNISINTLTSNANVSRSTFYRLFDSIPNLIDFTNDYVDKEIFKKFTNDASKVYSPEEWLKVLSSKLYNNRDKLRIMYTSDLKGQWLNYLNNKYKKWLKNNIFKHYNSKIIPENMAIEIFTKVLSSAVDYWLSKPMPEEPEIFKKQIFTILNNSPLNFSNL